MSVRLYGIPNCDTVKKARAWLDARAVVYEFVDYKKVGADRGKLEAWTSACGWEKVLNRAGTTFRKLHDAQKQDLDRDSAVALMLAQPSCIKRPVVEWEHGLLIGFREAEWEDALR